MSSRVPLLLFSVTLAGTLLVTAPASLLSPVIDALSDNRVGLANCRGTIWHGAASPLLRLNNGSTLALAGLHWEIRLGGLLSGALQADLGWDAMPQTEPMQLTVRRQNLEIRQLRAVLPAQLIGEFSTFLKPAQFSGSILLLSEQLNLTGDQLDGQASLQWKHAGSALSMLNPLGDYQLLLNSKANNMAFTLSTLAGALRLDGQGDWSPAQGLKFQGTAQAAPDQQEALAELLHHLGPQASPGVHTISLSGAR